MRGAPNKILAFSQKLRENNEFCRILDILEPILFKMASFC